MKNIFKRDSGGGWRPGSAPPPHEGLQVRLANLDLVLPRLTCDGLRRHWPTFMAVRKQVETLTGEDLLHELTSVQVLFLHSAFKRNYPDLNVADLEQLLSPGEAGDLFTQLLELSRLRLGEKPVQAVPDPEAASPSS